MKYVLYTRLIANDEQNEATILLPYVCEVSRHCPNVKHVQCPCFSAECRTRGPHLTPCVGALWRTIVLGHIGVAAGVNTVFLGYGSCASYLHAV